jgi:uncharacterized protein with GYD domain
MIYANLWKLTDEGVKTMNNVPQWSERVKQVCREYKGDLKNMYLCMGEYDVICLIDAPTDAAMFNILTAVTSWGVAHTETLRCMPVEEYAQAIKMAA